MLTSGSDAGRAEGLHARLGATMLCVAHDQVEAMTLADRICVLKSGVVQQVGTPRSSSIILRTMWQASLAPRV